MHDIRTSVSSTHFILTLEISIYDGIDSGAVFPVAFVHRNWSPTATYGCTQLYSYILCLSDLATFLAEKLV